MQRMVEKVLKKKERKCYRYGKLNCVKTDDLKKNIFSCVFKPKHYLSETKCTSQSVAKFSSNNVCVKAIIQ